MWTQKGEFFLYIVIDDGNYNLYKIGKE